MPSTVEQLITLLENTAILLNRAQTKLKKCPNQRLTRGYIKTRMQSVQEYWNTFKNTHQELVKVVPKEKVPDIPYFVNEDYFVYEDLYTCIMADLKDLASASTNPTHCQTGSDSQTKPDDGLVKLPRINLPSFSGVYEEWPEFQDLFSSLVHNNSSLSQVQKLRYLKSTLTGEAETLLRHVQITDNNYEQAWQTLKVRYGNKRIIVNSILKRLFWQRKIVALTANSIKSLLDTTTECINSLKNLKLSSDSWDPFIIFLVVQKLDPETHREWEEFAYQQTAEELPTYNDLCSFLRAKFRTLELTTLPARERTIKLAAVHMATSTNIKSKKCSMCKEDHTLCHCKEFTRMEPTERCDYVKANNLCFNCLAPGHPARNCHLNMSCRICHKRHHTLVHQSTSIVVLDEADRMLDMGFMPSVEKMMEHSSMVPVDQRQTLHVFSATFPEDIQHLAGRFLNNYLFVAVGIVGGASADVEQIFHQVTKYEKQYTIKKLIEDNDKKRILVFVETKRNADFLAAMLSEQQMMTSSIHGGRMQRERELALQNFKSGAHFILVATAGAARGLDIKNVDIVVNYDLPKSIDEYVHRIGRTGRVGNRGKAVSFFHGDQDTALVADLGKILRRADQPIPDFLQGGGNATSRGGKYGGSDVRDQRQTLHVFSATFPEDIQHLAGRFLNNYLFVAVGIVGGASADVEQIFHQVTKYEKQYTIKKLIEDNDKKRILVFVETKLRADFTAAMLSEQQMMASSIHEGRMQRERELALQNFKSGARFILVATAGAARGLDIKNVDIVVNYDLPKSIDEYVHRIGRTGRVGNRGKAVSFFDGDQDTALVADLGKILRRADQPIPDFLQGGGNATSRGGKYGGSDVRNFNNASAAVSQGEEPEEEW